MASIKDYIDELRQQVAELKEHPFKNTTINDYYGDWNVRFFKRHLCVWDDLEELKGYTGWNAEEYCEKLNGQKDVERIFAKTDLHLFLFPDRGGFLYLVWER